MNFKLQYRPEEPNHWWGGLLPEEKVNTLLTGEKVLSVYPIIPEFHPIAPQDQEKVNHLMMTSPEWHAFNNGHNIKFDTSKLYDSGDLEFELKELAGCKIVGCKSNGGQFNCIGEGCEWNPLKFWILKEKEKTYSDVVIKEGKKEWRCEGGYKFCQKDDQGNCSCKESNESKHIDYKQFDEEEKEVLLKFRESKIKQLQDRIVELEEHRERLIAKLINAGDKIKELESHRHT